MCASSGRTAPYGHGLPSRPIRYRLDMRQSFYLVVLCIEARLGSLWFGDAGPDERHPREG